MGLMQNIAKEGFKIAIMSSSEKGQNLAKN